MKDPIYLIAWQTLHFKFISLVPSVMAISGVLLIIEALRNKRNYYNFMVVRSVSSGHEKGEFLHLRNKLYVEEF